MAKEHKKLYKAGKNWLVVTLFAVAAGTALATTTAHADTTTDEGQNTVAVQQNAVTTTGNDEETGSTAATNNQPVPVAPQATAQNDGSNGQEDRVDDSNDGVSDELLAKIDATQKAIDQQKALISKDEATYKSFKQKENDAKQALPELDAKYKEAQSQADAAQQQYFNDEHGTSEEFNAWLKKYEIAQRAYKLKEQVYNQSNEFFNKAEAVLAKLPNEKYYLASLLNQLSSLKKQQLAEMQKHQEELKNQTYLLTITYVDQAGNIIGTKQYAGKYNQDVTKEVKLTPAGYHYADDSQRTFKLSSHNDSVNVLVIKDTAQPTTVHEQVNYVDTDGQIVGTQTLTGQPGQQFIAGNLTIPTGYKLEQSGSILIALGDSDSQFTVQVVREQPNRPVDLSQNNGWLDSYSAQNGKLHLAGWHVSSASADYQYPYIIVLDNGREVGRAQAQLVDRPDVDRLYPNTNGRQAAGFIADVDIPTYAYGDRLTVIARFSNDPAGNGQYQDYYFNNLNPVTDLNANKASLDGYHLSTNSWNGNIQLNVVGWHAAGRSVTEGSHWLILFDNTTGSEIQRVKLSDADNYVVSRPDVARAFPTILNAGESGFNVSFAFDPAQLDGHRLAIVSRWTTDPAGNGNATDYWFAPQTFTAAQPTSRTVRGTGDGVGALDKWAVYINPALGYDNPNRICFFVSGWHASNAAAGRPYHDIMLIDNTTGQQVGGATYANPMLPAQETSRPDIARLYGSQYQNAGESGFKIGLQTPQFAFGHRYTLISRYATDEYGNNAVQQSYYLGQINQDMANYGDGHDFFN
ncbi:KxYKxGKxW signal peptide domain-containing protein [Limosilactobacillus antri]|uniref:KxYKxGKxW signal peptide domain-containing protein n=1 Tax=Limosilactobacillus antri TaxID=227943 RepID=UPI001F59F11E|nr:KxYKxGKxW signal peptide domain-containing protein [Limosilactobacillus antri]